MAGRQTREHQRAEIKPIENQDSRIITFSKRKSSIYKRGSELVTLCGAEVGVVAISPGGNPISFAHPSIERVANRFLNQNPSTNYRSHALIESQVQIHELSQQHDKFINQIEAEKARGKVLKQLTEGESQGAWWEAPVEELNLQELNQMKARMEELRQSLWRSINQRTQGGPSAFFRGQSSS